MLEPFLFFEGEVVDEAVISYLSGHPAMATQEAYDMLVQACWNRLSPAKETLEQMDSSPEEHPVWLVEMDEEGSAQKEQDESFTYEQHAKDVFSSNEDSAFFHCSEHFGSAYDPQFISCVQELWHGYGTMMVYDPAVEQLSTTSSVAVAVAPGFNFASVQLEQCSATVETCDADVTQVDDMAAEMAEMAAEKEEEEEDFGSSSSASATAMPVTNESKDTFFTWSMFFMLCSVAAMSVFYVVMKMKDEECEQVIVDELNLLRRKEEYDVLQYQTAYATDDEMEEEEREEEAAPYKENVVMEMLVKPSKAGRPRRLTRSFGSSLHNR